MYHFVIELNWFYHTSDSAGFSTYIFCRPICFWLALIRANYPVHDIVREIAFRPIYPFRVRYTQNLRLALPWVRLDRTNLS